jgi:hypothetical protein
MRTGEFVKIEGSLEAFLPNPLPPYPKLAIDAELRQLLSEGDRLLYLLNNLSVSLPQIGSIKNLLTINEAMCSLQIDDSEITLFDYFKCPAENEAAIYLSAIDLGLRLIKDIAQPLYIINSIQKEIVKNSAENINAGSYRTTQKFLGSGKNPDKSKYIPPPPGRLTDLMNDFEKYISADLSFPVPVNAALIHGQFELIQPFLNANGKTGRVLIHLHLAWKNKLKLPLLSISRYLLNNETEYFDRLNDLHTSGNWEGWIKFFVRGINFSAEYSLEVINKLLVLDYNHINKIINDGSATSVSLKFYKVLFERPVVDLRTVMELANVSKQTANQLVYKFTEYNILEEITGQQRNRIFVYKELLNIFK